MEGEATQQTSTQQTPQRAESPRSEGGSRPAGSTAETTAESPAEGSEQGREPAGLGDVDQLARQTRELWRATAENVRKPPVGAAVAGAAVLAAGALWGASEAAVAAVAAYAVFRMLRSRGRGGRAERTASRPSAEAGAGESAAPPATAE